MHKQSYGSVSLINLPGTGSLLSRSWIIYRELFGKFLHLSGLFLLGLAVNLSLNSFITYLVQDASQFQQAIGQIVILLVNVTSGLFLSFILSATILLVHGWATGHNLSIAEVLQQAKTRYKSLFWAWILLSFVVYSSMFTVVLAVLFSVLFYFCTFIALLDKEKGVASLAKSRYLVHGIFFKSLGRYAAMSTLIFVLPLLVSYVVLAIPSIGWIFFMAIIILLLFFSFPFFTIYEYLRYSDVLAIDRDQPFVEHRGERVGIVAWVALGAIISSFAWIGGLIGPTGQMRVGEIVEERLERIGIPLIAVMTENLEKVSEILDRLNVRSDASIPLIDDEEQIID